MKLHVLRQCCTREHRPGQALVETALVLPILALLLLGVIEFGLILYAHVQVANAAREAARAASLYNPTRYLSSGLSSAGDPLCSNSGVSYDGWTLQQTIQQAIVYREPMSFGSDKDCPDPNGAIRYTSLGRLDPTIVFTATVTPAQTTYYNSTSNPNSAPTAGTTGTVTLTYPYRLPILSNLIPFLKNPILIKKSVQYEYVQ